MKGGGGAAAVDSSSKDGHATARAPAQPRSFVLLKLVVRPVLLFAVLATCFLAAALVLFIIGGGGGPVSYYRLPTLAVPDVLLAAPCVEKEEVEVVRWWARPAARSAWHNMSDEELLWAASFEPRRPGPRRPSAPRKVAFMFLMRGPLPLAPLWARFFRGHKGHYSIYVHILPSYRGKTTPLTPSSATGISPVRLVPVTRAPLGSPCHRRLVV
jgi:hypothetical protein